VSPKNGPHGGRVDHRRRQIDFSAQPQFIQKLLVDLGENASLAPFRESVEAGAFTDAEFGSRKQMPRDTPSQDVHDAFQASAIIFAGSASPGRFEVFGNQRLELPPKFIRHERLHDLASLLGQAVIIS
jgi:hypothetical protein